MAKLDRAGLFKASPVSNGLEQKDTGSLQWGAQFLIKEMFNIESGQWDDVSDQQWEITGYFTVIKKDGDLNETQVEKLKDSLGWDGADFLTLQNDYSSKVVQLECDYEEYNGKQSLRVKWMHPENFEGGSGALRTMDQAALSALNSKYGAKLRMKAGPKPTGVVGKPGARVGPPAKPANAKRY